MSLNTWMLRTLAARRMTIAVGRVCHVVSPHYRQDSVPKEVSEY